MKTIITQTDSFSIMGIVHGKVTVSIIDDSTDVFTAQVSVETNKGNGSTTIKNISGNGTIKRKVAGNDVTAEITKWSCTPNHLSFHLKAKVKKSIINKVIFNKDMSGDR